MSSAMFSGLLLLLCTVLVVQSMMTTRQPIKRHTPAAQQMFQNKNINDYPWMNIMQISQTNQQNQAPYLFGSTYYSKENQINIGSTNSEKIKAEREEVPEAMKYNSNDNIFVPARVPHQNKPKEVSPQSDIMFGMLNNQFKPYFVNPLDLYPNDQTLTGQVHFYPGKYQFVPNYYNNNDQVNHQVPASDQQNLYQTTPMPNLQKQTPKPAIAPEFNSKKDFYKPFLIETGTITLVKDKPQPVSTPAPVKKVQKLNKNGQPIWS